MGRPTLPNTTPAPHPPFPRPIQNRHHRLGIDVAPDAGPRRVLGVESGAADDAEAIGAEVAGFGVRSLVFVTGDMRTPFVASSVDGGWLVPLCDVCKGTVVEYVM